MYNQQIALKSWNLDQSTELEGGVFGNNFFVQRPHVSAVFL